MGKLTIFESARMGANYRVNMIEWLRDLSKACDRFKTGLLRDQMGETELPGQSLRL